jgi:hypothetical protein
MARRWTLLLLIAIARLANAQPTDDVERLLHEGVEMRKSGDDRAAYELFVRAFATTPSPRVAAQLGFAEQALGYWVDADQHLRAALAADDPWIASHRQVLEEAARYVSDHIGQLQVTGTAGTIVRLNGRPVGVLPLAQPMRLVAGVAILEARLPNSTAVVRTVMLAPGELAREHLDLEPLPPPPPPSLAPPSVVAKPARPPRRWRRPTGIALLVAGALTAAAAAAVLATPPAPRPNASQAATEQYNGALPSHDAGGGVLAGVGAAALVVGAVLLRRSPRSAKAALSPMGASLSIAGAF